MSRAVDSPELLRQARGPEAERRGEADLPARRAELRPGSRLFVQRYVGNVEVQAQTPVASVPPVRPQNTATEPRPPTPLQQRMIEEARAAASICCQIAYQRAAGLAEPRERWSATARSLARQLLGIAWPDLDWIASVIGEMRDRISAPSLAFRDASGHPMCGAREGYVIGSQPSIYLCEAFFNETLERRTQTLIHEAAHRAGIGEATKEEYCPIFDCATPCGGSETADAWAHYIHCLSGQRAEQGEVIDGRTRAPARQLPPPPASDKGHLQRRAANPSEASAVPPIVHEVLRSPGQPIDAATRTFMEPRFGQDFAQVRVHTDARAAESARAVNALAYTVGRNVVFGAGQYAPGTTEGRRLMAHELAHVVQQNQAFLGQAEGPAEWATEQALEADAKRRAATILNDSITTGDRRRPAMPSLRSGLTLQRRADAEHSPLAPLAYQVAPDAFEGIELAYTVGGQMFRQNDLYWPVKPIVKTKYYWLRPILRRPADHIFAYVAYNPDYQRNEYVIGPASLSTFLERLFTFRFLAGLGYPTFSRGNPHIWAAATAAMNVAAIKGDLEAVAINFSTAWQGALSDPNWYLMVGTSVVSAVPRPAPNRGVIPSAPLVVKAPQPAVASGSPVEVPLPVTSSGSTIVLQSTRVTLAEGGIGVQQTIIPTPGFAALTASSVRPAATGARGFSATAYEPSLKIPREIAVTPREAIRPMEGSPTGPQLPHPAILKPTQDVVAAKSLADLLQSRPSTGLGLPEGAPAWASAIQSPVGAIAATVSWEPLSLPGLSRLPVLVPSPQLHPPKQQMPSAQPQSLEQHMPGSEQEFPIQEPAEELDPLIATPKWCPEDAIRMTLLIRNIYKVLPIYLDPITNEWKNRWGRLQADHFVPVTYILNEIIGEARAKLLTSEQITKLLTYEGNFQALPAPLNYSKAGILPSDWETYKGRKISLEWRLESQKHEQRIIAKLRRMMHGFLAVNRSKGLIK